VANDWLAGEPPRELKVGSGTVQRVRRLPTRRELAQAALRIIFCSAVLTTLFVLARVALAPVIVATHGVALDAWCDHPQLADVIALASAVPQATIVMCHVGGVRGYGAYAGKKDEVHAAWRASMAELATCPNVSVKLGRHHARSTGMPVQCFAPMNKDLATFDCEGRQRQLELQVVCTDPPLEQAGFELAVPPGWRARLARHDVDIPGCEAHAEGAAAQPAFFCFSRSACHSMEPQRFLLRRSKSETIIVTATGIRGLSVRTHDLADRAPVHQAPWARVVRDLFRGGVPG
jgi:hypothetical protein